MGIGTATPSTQFDVNGNARIRSIPAGVASNQIVTADTFGNIRSRTAAEIVTPGSGVLTANNGLIKSLNNVALGGTLTANTTIAQAANTLNFTSSADNAFTVDGTTLNVDADTDRVGIGTNAPNAKLNVDADEENGVLINGENTLSIGLNIRNESAASGSPVRTQILMENQDGLGATTFASLLESYSANSSAEPNATRLVSVRGDLIMGAGDVNFLRLVNSDPGLGGDSEEQRVGVGTNTPTAKFEVAEPNTVTDYSMLQLTTANGRGMLIQAPDPTDDDSPFTFQTNNTFKFKVKGNDMVVFDKDFEVGIGTTDPLEKLDVVGNVQLTGQLKFNSIDGDKIFLTQQNADGSKIGHSTNWNIDYKAAPETAVSQAGEHNFFTADGLGAHVSRMKITNTGEIGIGTILPTQLLSVNGTAGKPGGGTWATFSDMRVKKNINLYTDGLEQLLKITPKSFQYNGKGGYDDDGKTHIGIIAQEMREIAPYMINEIETEDFRDQLTYDGSALIYMTVNAIKEQQKEIETLKAENEALQKRLVKIEELLNKK